MLTTVHRTQIAAKCPHGGNDHYEATFRIVGDLVLKVEEIAAEIQKQTEWPIYQETLTARLAVKLSCEVTTVGRHGRFETECVAGPA